LRGAETWPEHFGAEAECGERIFSGQWERETVAFARILKSIHFLFAHKANTRGSWAQLYVRTDVVQN